ncbi:MAG: LEVG family PEP-CTERM protein [Coleofasciculus chthonoplastes F3-SA18-01]|uniref:LEVG family PEP-CTERM protein n=1 Tax=Coleofasciculus chthonoplastes TaxID=64178 RepID=UPI0032F47832
MKSLSTLFRHSATVASLLAASTVTVGLMAPSASAIELLPPQDMETEINVGVTGSASGCLDANKCIDPSEIPWIASIESLVDETSGTKSRLFIDLFQFGGDPLQEEEDSVYNGGSLGTATLKSKDIGTTPGGAWFRPSETNADGSVGEEQGQLEVGTYEFKFTKLIPELTIKYFDTETSGTTGVPNFFAEALTDGMLISGDNPVPLGEDGNLYYQTWKDVSEITLKLGKDTAATGDGVDFQLIKNVPEPGTVLGLGALAMAGAFGLRKRNKKSDV